MADIIPYSPPGYLQGEDVDTIYSRMMQTDIGNGQTVQSVIATSQGSMFWDVCRPTAIEKSSLVQMIINQVIQSAFIQYAIGTDLDNHGQGKGVPRNGAVSSIGTISINGVQGTLIPIDTLFATASTGGIASIEFQTTDSNVVIPSTGTIQVDVQAVIAGTNSNVQANTVIMQIASIIGITSVTNASATLGGLDAESDDVYRQRILTTAAKKPGSGSKYDYMAWASSVTGVGSVQVIPEWNGFANNGTSAGSGKVKVAIMNSSNQPANSTLIATVQQYINGLAPIGAIVTVAAPTAVIIAYVFAVKIDITLTDIATIQSSFLSAVQTYYAQAMNDGVVRFHKIASLLVGITGIIDYTALTMNSASADIIITLGSYPSTIASNIICTVNS